MTNTDRLELSDAALEQIARAIAEARGHDPDDSDRMLICGPQNEPLPCWMAFTEEASAAWLASPGPAMAAKLSALEEGYERLRGIGEVVKNEGDGLPDVFTDKDGNKHQGPVVDALFSVIRAIRAECRRALLEGQGRG